MSTAGPVCPQETSVLVTITGNKLIKNCNAATEKETGAAMRRKPVCSGGGMRAEEQEGAWEGTVQAEGGGNSEFTAQGGVGRLPRSPPPPEIAGPLRLECSQRGKDGTGRSEEGRREPRLRDRESPQGASDPILSVVGTFGAQE